MPRILFVAAHRPGRSPSQRYRFEQFMPYWAEKGFEVTTSWTIDEADDNALYRPGAVLPKARIYLKSHQRRAEQVRLAARHDLVFLQRETFMTRGTRFERMLAATGVPMVYDFDDAIWLMNVSDGNRSLRWLKDPGKIQRILPMAELVIAGNRYLADYAARFHPRVEVIPTVIDTDAYHATPEGNEATGPLVIGWTGSRTTIPHLEMALPMLLDLQRVSPVPFMLRVISDRDFHAPGLQVENRRWSSSTETADLAGIHIGIMPMEENEWGRGKCGFKGLQYMGMGKPVVLQRHGVNTTIVRHGENGLLASTPEEWKECLLRLLADADLRRSLGSAARATVEAHYSIRAWRDRYLQLFHELISETSHDRSQTHRSHSRP